MKLHRSFGFTLVEILISVSIFMILMGVTAKLLSTLSGMGKKSLAVVEMHQYAAEIMNVYTNEIRNMHIMAAWCADFQDDENPHFTFMANLKREMGKSGGSYGPWSITADYANTDFIWVRWQPDLMNGNILRARTRLPPNGRTRVASTRGDDLHRTSTNSKDGVTEYHTFATPQTEYVYFEGKGSTITPTVDWNLWDAEKNIGAGEKRRMHQHCTFETYQKSLADPKFFEVKHYPHFLHSYSVVGNRFLLSDDTYAVRNPDGISYNKDRLNLLGSSDQTTGSDPQDIFPNQLVPLNQINNVECVCISFHLSDGTMPVDDDTLNDGNATVDIKGTGPQLDKLSPDIIKNRPDYSLFSFLMHNIPVDALDIDDIDQDSSTHFLTQAIRNRIHRQDENPLDYGTYIDEMKRRQQAMQVIIEEQGYIAQIFNCSVAMPK